MTMDIILIVKIVCVTIVSAVAVYFALKEGYGWNKGDEDLCIQILDRLDRRTHYGDKPTLLNDYEAVFWILQKLEAEVNGGGFDQFFFNTENSLDSAIVDCAEEVGAHDIARICRKALDIEASYVDDDARLDDLSECDQAFYDSEDNLTRLCAAFARRNRRYFRW